MPAKAVTLDGAASGGHSEPTMKRSRSWQALVVTLGVGTDTGTTVTSSLADTGAGTMGTVPVTGSCIWGSETSSPVPPQSLQSSSVSGVPVKNVFQSKSVPETSRDLSLFNSCVVTKTSVFCNNSIPYHYNKNSIPFITEQNSNTYT